jgi:hypothetical protein
VAATRFFVGSVLGLALLGAGAGGGASLPPVFLNHFFVVIDAPAYAALQASRFATGEWAPFEKRTTARNDQTYTGIYWYGRRTYFEVFEPGAQGAPGVGGIAFSVDEAGGSAAVKAAWTASLGGAQTMLVTRRTDADEVPWFDLTASAAAEGRLRVWLMEYHRDFLARWYGDLTPARGITRAEVLDRYVAKIGRAPERETALFGDVTELKLDLDAREKEALVKHLKPLGWSVRQEGGATILAGPEGVRLEITTATAARRGVREAVFFLQRKVEPRQERFGSVTFELEGERARIRFAS